MNTPQAPDRCAIYCRISLDASGEEAGTQRQEADCLALAERLGLEVVKVFVDNDLGASTRSRAKSCPAYDRMLAEAKSGNFSTIVAYSNSRLTRRSSEWLKLIELTNSGSVTIRTVVSGSHDLSTADGRAMTIAVWDGAEDERISVRLKAAHRHEAQQGRVWLEPETPRPKCSRQSTLVRCSQPQGRWADRSSHGFRGSTGPRSLQLAEGRVGDLAAAGVR